MSEKSVWLFLFLLLYAAFCFFWGVRGSKFSSESPEKYYLAGLKIKPDHNGINEYLGELYVKTGRMDLAKERLAVLKSCNCEEYSELKEVIEKN